MTDDRPTHIDLFSGIGGFALAARWAGFRTIAFCEIDKYCQKILAKNFGAEVMADARCERDAIRGETRNVAREARTVETHGEERKRMRHTVGNGCSITANIFEFDGTAYRCCDLLTGGFPCQPFSVAGKRRGAADDRAIWPEMLRVIKEARPAWVLGENVPGIIPMELDNVLSDLENIGYATRSFVIPACAVDARHRRDRLWIVGRLVADLPRIQQGREIERTERQRARPESESIPDAESTGLERFGTDARQPQIAESRNGSALADTSSQSANGHASRKGTQYADTRIGGEYSQWCQWQPEPDVGRVAHGIPARVDRLKGLGNAIVPQVTHEILREIRNNL